MNLNDILTEEPTISGVNIVPVIDLRARLSLDVAYDDRTTVVIVLRIELAGRGRIVGIVVDGVSDVYHLRASQMKAPPELALSGAAQFAKSIAMVDEKMIIILDVDQLYEDGDELVEASGSV